MRDGLPIYLPKTDKLSLFSFPVINLSADPKARFSRTSSFGNGSLVVKNERKKMNEKRIKLSQFRYANFGRYFIIFKSASFFQLKLALSLFIVGFEVLNL